MAVVGEAARPLDGGFWHRKHPSIEYENLIGVNSKDLRVTAEVSDQLTSIRIKGTQDNDDSAIRIKSMQIMHLSS